MRIPVIGNGDIDGPVKAKEMLDRYGVDGIMIGRATVGRPWIFRDISHYLTTGNLLPEPSVDEKADLALLHLEKSLELDPDLAEGLAGIDGIDVDLSTVQTNMVYCTLTTAAVSDEQLLTAAAEKGVQFLSLGPRAFRLVTHHGIKRSDIDTAIEIIREIVNP